MFGAFGLPNPILPALGTPTPCPGFVFCSRNHSFFPHFPLQAPLSLSTTASRALFFWEKSSSSASSSSGRSLRSVLLVGGKSEYLTPRLPTRKPQIPPNPPQMCCKARRKRKLEDFVPQSRGFHGPEIEDFVPQSRGVLCSKTEVFLLVRFVF